MNEGTRPGVAALIERGRVTADEVRSMQCTYTEWVALVPAMTDEAFAARVEQALRNPQGEPFEVVYAPELLRRFRGAARAARAYAESIDNVREALGQRETHYLVVADDVGDLVKVVEQCANEGDRRAMAALRKLRPPPLEWSFESYPLTGTVCSVCGEPQRQTPGGASCPNGHGGA